MLESSKGKERGDGVLLISSWGEGGCFQSQLEIRVLTLNPIHPVGNSSKKQKPCTKISITPSINIIHPIMPV